jgi:hypothetical protein
MRFTLNYYSGVQVTFYEGTSLFDAKNPVVVKSLYDTFNYTAHTGNTVFMHVKGVATQKATFQVTAQMVVTRITPYPVKPVTPD